MIEPLTPLQPGSSSTTTNNTPPVFTFTAPMQDVAAEVGDQITVSWSDYDPDNNAAITIVADHDLIFGNGNEVVVLPLRMEDPDGTADTFQLDTSSLQAGSYLIVAKVSDGVNPELYVAAPGRILLYGAGLLSGNVSPSIQVNKPDINLGVSHRDLLTIEYCGQDPDGDGKTPPGSPDIILLFDLDQDPNNDLDLTGTDAQDVLEAVCLSGNFPVLVPGGGAYVIGCVKDNKCGIPQQVPQIDPQGNPVTDGQGNPVYVTQLTPPTTFDYIIDVTTTPPLDDGNPYYIRATMWDHVNLPVSAYGPGTLNITSLGSGTIDLRQVGRVVSGARFLGFNRGDRAGSTGTDLGDINGDGVDDFAIVSRYGRGYEVGNVGTAHIIMGLPDKQKYGYEIPLNSIGTLYTGSLNVMQYTTFKDGSTAGTDGIVSVARTGDLTGDDKPDVLFGTPYVEVLYDDHDDDPQDKDGLCYFDYRPNPLSTTANGGGNDDITNYDWREGTYLVDNIPYICSNDYDLTRMTPIDGGYVFLLGSENVLDRGVNHIWGAGQQFQGEHGARFRGAWYPRNIHDITQTKEPNILDPNNRFGETVATMPPMTNTSRNISPRFGSWMIISSPMGFDGRGMIVVTPLNDFTDALGTTNAASIPVYVPVSDCCRTVVFPDESYICGAAIGDHLGYACAAGDFNGDGSRDILCGAPGADRDGINDKGTVYVLFGRPDFPTSAQLDTYNVSTTYNFGILNPPRMEIRGVKANDAFGAMQTNIGDINQDGLADIAFASKMADGPGGIDSGFIGIVFGGRRLTGENTFTIEQVGTSQLPGVKIYGTQPNGHAGAIINNAGDFNADGVEDLLITAPDVQITVNGIKRRGVAYLIFGGPHMINKTFLLDQVGTAALPGIVFASPYAMGSADEAPIDFAGPAGDVNGDHFADILIGVSEADYINPLEPSQRRIDSGEMYLIYGSNTGANIVRK